MKRVKTFIIKIIDLLNTEKFIVELKVFILPQCPSCPGAKKIAREVAKKHGLSYTEVDISTPDGRLEGFMHQIMSTPSIAIDDDIIMRGKPVSREELEREIRKRLGK